MTTRVSTNGSFQNGVRLMQQLQTALDYTQRQIASGRRILTPSDDPIATSRSLEIRESLSRLDQFDRNSTIATNRLSQEEAALASVNNVLQRARELALQANNAPQSTETRGLIAVEMRELLDAVTEIANQQDGNGRYLFAGNLGDTQPVGKAGNTYTYNGDDGQRLIQIGEGRRVADGDSGADVFFRIRSGNGVFSATPDAANAGTAVANAGSLVDPTLYDQDTYTITFVDPDTYEVRDSAAVLVAAGAFQPGDNIAFRGIELAIDGSPAAGDEFTVAPSVFKDVFATIADLADAIDSGGNSDAARAAMTNGINAGILGIDQAIGNVLDVRTQVGSRLSAIEKQQDTNSSFALVFQETIDDIESLDYAEAISRLSIETTTLEAAQKSFVRTQQLSLFNYL